MIEPYEDKKKSLVAELLGTFVLAMVGPSAAIGSYLIPGMDSYREHVIIAAAISIWVAIGILTLGKISGAHINPSVSLSYAIAGTMPRRLASPYFAVQLAAAVLAGICLHILYTPLHSPTHYGSTKIQNGATPETGLLLEIAGTFFLCLAALIAATRLKGKYKEQAMLVGIALFVLTVIIGPFTGASFNPSRSLAPALASTMFENQYVYWVGPLTGAALAGLVFPHTGMKEQRKEDEKARQPPSESVAPIHFPSAQESGEDEEKDEIQFPELTELGWELVISPRAEHQGSRAQNDDPDFDPCSR